MNRAMSVSSPNAGVSVTNWEMLPGNTATKNAATIQPTWTRQRESVINAKHRQISITPEIAMTAAGAGIHGGTCA